ncbi:MAG: type II secretion system F family protein [Chloroflexi bacterium]|nr:type II secretion system F family protein [Chloroflexota bacterium]
MKYQFVAFTQERKVEKGIQVAPSADAAVAALSGSGYRVFSVKPVSPFFPTWDKLLNLFSRVPVETVINFSRGLALLHESGLDIVTSLEIIRKQNSSRKFRTVLSSMITDLRGGERLSEAMSRHPAVFSKVYVQSIRASERSGSIETILRQMADYMDKEAKAARAVREAMRYPIIVGIVAVIVVAILAVFVLPVFTSLYSSLRVELPAATRALLAVVNFFVGYWSYLTVGGLLLALSLYLFSRTPQGRLLRDRLILKMPLIGRFAHLQEIVRYCWNSSILYKAGLPLPEIFALVTETSGNLVMKQTLASLHRDVLNGEGLSRAMAKYELFLPMMVEMVRVGEATGSLDSTLETAAAGYQEEAEERRRALIALIQPVIIVVLGLVVGLIGVSLVSAMYSIYGAV